jgi:ribA/ribD-fused uncharacterized protein
MNTELIISILSSIHRGILIHFAEIFMSKKNELGTDKKWIRFYDPKNEYFEFSNFFKHKIPLLIDGKKYKTTEHYFQAQKYSKDILKNLEYMQLIIDQNTPGMTKILAGRIKMNKDGTIQQGRYDWQKKLIETQIKYKDFIYFDPVEWELRRDSVMLTALEAKFTQDQHCKEILLSTEDSVLSENTSRDPYWGNGGHLNTVGRLGELLMLVRDKIRNNLL